MRYLLPVATLWLCHQAVAQSSLREELERIRELDQQDRQAIGASPPGPQRDSVGHHMAVQDSLNLIRGTAIIDSAGWRGPADVGQNASRALYIVIQHADLATQEKYLPEMRLAVEEGKAFAM